MAVSTLSSSLMQCVLDGPLPMFAALHDRFTCVVCRSVLKDPWQTECGHRMCFSCMNQTFEFEPEVMCPAKEDDCEIISRSRMFYDRGMCRELLQQQVFCLNKDAGCTLLMKWSELHCHLDMCEYLRVECPFEKFGCPEHVPKKCRDDHIKSCKYVPVPCSLCKAEVGRFLLKDHEKDCPKKVIDCPYGCGEKMCRNEMETHKQSCDFRPQQCQYQYIGCKFEGSESEVSQHEVNAHNEHFDKLLQYVEKVDLKRIQLETRLEEQTNESSLLKKKCFDANKKISQLDGRLTAVQEEVDRLKVEIQTFATKDELIGQQNHMQETVEATENLISTVEQRVVELEQVHTSGRVGGMSGETLREMEATTQQVGVHDIRLAEMDVRFQCLETANYEGVLLWKVTDYARRKQDAFQNRVLSLYSQPFYTSRYGYKMCGRVYLNGDGMGKGTHLSLFFVLMRGEYDALLEWPFRQKVTLSLLDQSPARRDLSDTFRPDPTSSSFRRPTTEMNIASGCPMFISHSDLINSRFLKDDTIYMKVFVDIVDLASR